MTYRGENMELGEKIRQARQALGLSQRQLCGEEITRNMLSLIENGGAKPSMKTLAILAERLGKPISYFLEADAPDPADLVTSSDNLRKARQALEAGKTLYARQLLEAVTAPELCRNKLLLAAKIPGADILSICRELPSLDEELLLRAEAALAAGDVDRCRKLLAATQEQTPGWNLILGRLEMQSGNWEEASRRLEPVSDLFPESLELLEICFRELGDYKRAYEYACKQKR